MTGNDIADRFYHDTNDPGRIRTTEADLIRHINAGQLLIAMVRPDSVSARQELTLVAGAKQALPATATRLLDVTRAIHPTTGLTLSSVTLVDRHALDSIDRNWYATTESYSTRHYVYDNRAPKSFEVYPPAKVGAKVEVVLTAVPTPITVLTGTLAVDDLYMDPMLEYCLFRFYSYDTEYSNQPSLAGGRFNAFQGMLGVKLTRDLALSPDLNSRGATPTPGATAGGV